MAGRPPIKHDNRSVKVLFKHCDDAAQAFYTYPAIESIISGVASLDYGGNTRNLLKGVICKILMSADTISTQWIVDNMQYSKAHATKYALAARIASKCINLQSFTIKTLDKDYEYPSYYVSQDDLECDRKMLKATPSKG